MQGAAGKAKGGTATSQQKSKLHKSHIHAIYTPFILIFIIAKHSIEGLTHHWFEFAALCRAFYGQDFCNETKKREDPEVILKQV